MQDIEIDIEATPTGPISRRPELNEEAQQEIQGVFDIFDTKGTDSVEKSRVKVMMRMLGYEPQKDQLARMLVQNGIPHRATHIKYDDFYKLMTQIMNDKYIQEKMMRAFNLFDVDDTGFISFENLRSVAVQLGDDMTDAELREMIQEADLDKDGLVNASEFLRIMKKTELWSISDRVA